MKPLNSIPHIIKDNIFLWIYYTVMMLILVSWSDHETAPPESYRYIYLSLFVLPLIFDKNNNFLLFFTVFYTVGLYGIGFSYLPNRSMPYTLIMIVLAIKNAKKRRSKLSGWECVLVLGLLMVIVDYLGLLNMNSADILSTRRVWSVIIVCLLPAFLSDNINEDVEKLSFGFIISSFVLALQFILMGSSVAVSYDYASGIDRVAWMDPNYFAPVVGVGLIMSVLYLLEKNNTVLMRIFLYSTIVISSITIILSASRGAVSAVTVSLALIILMSRTKAYYKALMILVGVILIIVFYNSGYFDLLEYRMSDQANLTSGSGRYEIWSRKIGAFLDNSSFISLLFGLGYNASFYLGYQEGMGSHNDYVAFFCTYGLVGVALLIITAIVIPFFKIGRENRTHILTFIVFLLFVCITVEPLCNLYMPYWFFLFYIYCNADTVKK